MTLTLTSLWAFPLFLECESMINEVKRAETGCPQSIMQKFLAVSLGKMMREQFSKKLN